MEMKRHSNGAGNRNDLGIYTESGQQNKSFIRFFFQPEE